MKVSFQQRSMWRIALTVCVLLVDSYVATQVGPVWRRTGDLVFVQWSMALAMALAILLGAPWIGAWGKARIPCGRMFMAQLRITALGLFLPGAFSMVDAEAGPESWIPIVGALLLSELTAASYQFVHRTASLSPRLAPHARNAMFLAALSSSALLLVRDQLLPERWEGPAVVFRPVAQVFTGAQPAGPFVVLACLVLGLHTASHLLAERLPIIELTAETQSQARKAQDSKEG